ncbi:MAG: pseudouridine synthase [Ichthyobacteriaceae bacterium]|nr:pseudouridine synthase [Ichthyobacteriaceae bacterium]
MHYILHKPYGYLSQFTRGQQKRSKKLLGELFDFAEGTMAIGRLDEASEGLLLLTTNGKISDDIRSKSVDKEYYVQVDGVITPNAISKLINGVNIGNNSNKYTTLPAKVKLISNPNFVERIPRVRDNHRSSSWISVIITEGKFRQIRKMTASVGFPTLRLVRVRIGDIHIDDFIPGNIIEVDELLYDKSKKTTKN